MEDYAKNMGMKHVDVLEQTVDAWLSQRKTLTAENFLQTKNLFGTNPEISMFFGHKKYHPGN